MMNSIYIHIPFCKQACHYCDFHFSTSLKNKERFLSALKKEMKLYADYFTDKNISTIYIGGGTPSILNTNEIQNLIEEINKHWNIQKEAEITLEANPDDLTLEKIKELKQTSINRLSIGIQSFSDADLKYMNRAHSVDQAINSVKAAQDNGFMNITIDLIYGIPVSSDEQWQQNLDTAFKLNIQHISCYALTVEPRTALADFIKKGKAKNINDDQAAKQFEVLLKEAEKNNFTHYEISNFGKEGYFSKHNSNYWLKGNYLGLGPSAHSYNGTVRHWNIRNNENYIRGIENNKPELEKETITPNQHYNEYIMTSLRTIWGTDLNYLKQLGEIYLKNCTTEAQHYISSENLILANNKLTLTTKGKLIADKIASDLFVV